MTGNYSDIFLGSALCHIKGTKKILVSGSQDYTVGSNIYLLDATDDSAITLTKLN